MSEAVVTTPTPEAAPPPSAEDRQWAALREELEPKQEPAAEPEAAPEPARTAESEPEPDGDYKSKYENMQKAMQEERNLRRAEQERWKAVQELAQNLRAGKQQQQEQPEKPKVPSVEEDPIGFFKHENADLRAELVQLKQATQQFNQQTVQQQEFQQFMGLVDRSEREIQDPKSANHKADYFDACRHLEQGRVEELTDLIRETDPLVLQNAAHYGVTPQVMAQHMRVDQLNRDRHQIAETALRNNISPAMMYYEAAVRRGYKPSNVVALKPQEKVSMQRKAVQSSKGSISGGGGSKSTDDMNLSDLADLAAEDPDAFDKAWEKMAKAGKLG